MYWLHIKTKEKDQNNFKRQSHCNVQMNLSKATLHITIMSYRQN